MFLLAHEDQSGNQPEPGWCQQDVLHCKPQMDISIKKAVRGVAVGHVVSLNCFMRDQDNVDKLYWYSWR